MILAGLVFLNLLFSLIVLMILYLIGIIVGLVGVQYRISCNLLACYWNLLLGNLSLIMRLALHLIDILVVLSCRIWALGLGQILRRVCRIRTLLHLTLMCLLLGWRIGACLRELSIEQIVCGCLLIVVVFGEYILDLLVGEGQTKFFDLTHHLAYLVLTFYAHLF